MLKKIVKYYSSLSLFTKLVYASLIIAIVISASIFILFSSVTVSSNLSTINFGLDILNTVVHIWTLLLFLLGAFYLIIGIVRFIYEKN